MAGNAEGVRGPLVMACVNATPCVARRSKFGVRALPAVGLGALEERLQHQPVQGLLDFSHPIAGQFTAFYHMTLIIIAMLAG